MNQNKANSFNNISGGKNYLPLYNFFTSLKQNNFLVTPKQITDSNSIIAEYAPRVKNENELCNYLSPIFANSPEEQIQFRQIFDEYFSTVDTTPIEMNFWQKLLRHLKKYRWLYSLAAVVVLASVVYMLYVPRLDPRPFITLSVEKNKSPKKGFVTASLNIGPEPAGRIPGVKLKTSYDWGDSTKPDSLSHHKYAKSANYLITAYAAVYYKGHYQYTDTLNAAASVCFDSNTIQITPNIYGDSVQVNTPVKLTAGFTGAGIDSVSWTRFDDDSSVQFKIQANTATYTFTSEGQQTIYCTAVAGNITSPCSVKDSASFFVYDDKPRPYASLGIPARAKIISPKYKVKQKWFYLASVLGIVSLFFTSFFALRRSRNKMRSKVYDKEVELEYQQLVQSFSGKSGLVNIPFQNKNYLPLPEEEISEVARRMRQRINDDATFLHLPRTIEKAVVNAGFFVPVHANRTQQSEYLILIDEQFGNSQQVKLFEYLLELLVRQNVFIEKYYYKQQPRFCYSPTQTEGITLEKLSEKYPKHLLLIMGNAHQLIYQLYPVLDNTYIPILNRWQYKAVLTPVSFLDWGNKEKKVLLEELPVLPVDIPGQLLLFQKLFGEEINILADLKQYSNSFYETELVDFEDVDELADYCTNAGWANIGGKDKYQNILFQWIAALAVYPKVHWELTLAIGKNILDHYGNGNELNFTSLLRIARIRWMVKGQFPDYTRLELLKKLSKENEVIARETILILLNEIPVSELNHEHFAYEEKETQRLINEFNLYAYDPVKYAGYKRSKELVSQLWINKQITDAPVQNYIDNKDMQWSTLINKPPKAGEAVIDTKNIPADDYFGTASPANSLAAKIYLWSAAIAAVIFVASLISLIALIILNVSNSQRFKAITYRKAVTDSVKFNYVDTSGSKLADEVVLSVNTNQASLNNYQPAVLLLDINDSLKNITVTVNGDVAFDSVMSINYNEYDIALVKNKIAANTALPNFTAGTWILRNAIDSSGGNWNNSTLKFTSQELAAGGLNLTGMFTWRRDAALMGTEEFNGSYAADSRTIKLKGRSLSNVRKTGKNASLDLGAYTAVLSADEQNLTDGTWGSTDITARVIPLRDNNKWSATRDSANKKIITATEKEIPAANPIINIRFSDNSLSSSAASFANELKAKGFTVQKVEKWDYDENSRIYYYNAANAVKANEIKNLYNKYFPGLNVVTRLVQKDASVSSNDIITVWIRQYQPPAARFEIKNIQFQPSVKPNESLDVSFDIVNNGFADRAKVQGSICILSEPSCIDFSFSPIPSITIKQSINIDNKTAGKHELRVVVTALKIDQSLGFFTIEAPAAVKAPPENPYVQNNVPPLKKILWVGDNADNRKSLVDNLKDQSYTIIFAANNQTAFDYLQKDDYEIVITDISRDDKSETAIELLKKLPSKIAKTDVIILTSKKSEKKYAKEISALGYYQITTRADEVVEFIYKHTPGKSSK